MFRRAIILMLAVIPGLATTAPANDANLIPKTDAAAGISFIPASHIATDSHLSLLLDVTGLATQLKSIRSLIHETSDTHASRCGVTVDKRNTSSYASSRLQQQMIQFLKTRVTDDQVATMLNWYRSVPGERITRSEKKIRPESSFELFTSNLRQQPGWETRVQLIKEIERFTNSNRLGAIVGVEIEYGGLVQSGCIDEAERKSALQREANLQQEQRSQNNHNAERKINREQIMARIIRQDKPLMAQLFYHDTIDGIAFSLQDTSNTDLQQYVTFSSTGTARHVFTALVDAVDYSLQSASGTVTADIHSLATETNQ